jgi:hypothetical protein
MITSFGSQRYVIYHTTFEAMDVSDRYNAGVLLRRNCSGLLGR